MFQMSYFRAVARASSRFYCKIINKFYNYFVHIHKQKNSRTYYYYP